MALTLCLIHSILFPIRCLLFYSMNCVHFISRTNTFWGLVLGLMLFVSARVWYVSFVPTWWSNTSNSVVITIATVAVIDQCVSGKCNVTSLLSSGETRNFVVPELCGTSFIMPPL